MHSCRMDYFLPGVAPTHRRVELPLVVIAHFEGDLLAHEHIYWDQASEVGLVGAGLPADHWRRGDAKGSRAWPTQQWPDVSGMGRKRTRSGVPRQFIDGYRRIAGSFKRS